MQGRVLGITMGDPAGIGPEIVAKALLARPDLAERTVVFGSGEGLAAAAGRQGAERLARVEVREVPTPGPVRAGEPCEASGAASVAYLQAAVEAARRGEIERLATAPISKLWAGRAGFAFPGHTEYLADALSAREVAMMFVGERMKVVLATVHVPLRAVPEVLTTDRVVAVATLLHQALVRDFGALTPRLGIVGLNPHAGESGKLGSEELTVLEPAMATLRAHGLDVEGPLVPDAAFRMHADGRYDALVAMYHDQALIPIKLIEFERAVNVTLGLPIVRTSPDHGTAFDIAGKELARPTSMICALDVAARLAQTRSARAVANTTATSKR